MTTATNIEGEMSFHGEQAKTAAGLHAAYWTEIERLDAIARDEFPFADNLFADDPNDDARQARKAALRAEAKAAGYERIKSDDGEVIRTPAGSLTLSPLSSEILDAGEIDGVNANRFRVSIEAR